jgi:hypothetical protein
MQAGIWVRMKTSLFYVGSEMKTFYHIKFVFPQQDIVHGLL